MLSCQNGLDSNLPPKFSTAYNNYGILKALIVLAIRTYSYSVSYTHYAYAELTSMHTHILMLGCFSISISIINYG